MGNEQLTLDGRPRRPFCSRVTKRAHDRLGEYELRCVRRQGHAGRCSLVWHLTLRAIEPVDIAGDEL